MGIMRRNQIFFQNCLGCWSSVCPVREQPRCLGGCCMSLCLGAELTALCCGTTHISNPQNSSPCTAGAHQCPTWMEPSRASCTAVGKQDPARHSPRSWWHRLRDPSYMEPVAQPWAWKAACAKPEPYLCQARHKLQQTAVIAQGKMENLQKTNITNTYTN